MQFLEAVILRSLFESIFFGDNMGKIKQRRFKSLVYVSDHPGRKRCPRTVRLKIACETSIRDWTVQKRFNSMSSETFYCKRRNDSNVIPQIDNESAIFSPLKKRTSRFLVSLTSDIRRNLYQRQDTLVLKCKTLKSSKKCTTTRNKPNKSNIGAIFPTSSCLRNRRDQYSIQSQIFEASQNDLSHMRSWRMISQWGVVKRNDSSQIDQKN